MTDERLNSIVEKALDAMLNELEKKYPGIKEHEYMYGDELYTFKERMKFGLLLELVFAYKNR